MPYTIVALYHFTPLADAASVQAELRPLFAALNLCGTLLVAPEGINGTLAGSAENVSKLVALLTERFGLQPDNTKYSYVDEKPFLKLKVKLKKELITFREESANPNLRVGAYVAPRDWNDLIARDDVVVLDTRNMYETKIGTFRNAVDPQIEKFTEFADFVRTQMADKKDKKIAMFCTGGIRCEKASAFMLAEGFPEVYHLKGGILKYLEELPQEESLWDGACYVFDRRVAVEHGMKPAPFTMCFCCGYPLSPEDTRHDHFEDGVSCAYCYDWSSDKDKVRFRTRHQQMIANGTYTPLSIQGAGF